MVSLDVWLPRTLVGAPKALPVAEPGSAGFRAGLGDTEERQAVLEAMYAAAPEPSKTTADNTLRTVALLRDIDFEGYVPADGAEYPEDELGQSLKATAALIKAEVGVEAIALDAGGWDTHDFQQPLQGRMANLMDSLARSLAAFHRDLQAGRAPDVTTVVMSEFGRNALENGSQGTDHGHGNAMFLLGPHVDGGRVLSEWPGLDRDQLFEGQDLAITIDYRDVLAEVVRKRLGNSELESVFPDPGFAAVERGVVFG